MRPINPRGATVCRKCGRPLRMRSKYDVWMDALIADLHRRPLRNSPRCATYREVLQWMPAMRPYLKLSQTTTANFHDTLYTRSRTWSTRSTTTANISCRATSCRRSLPISKQNLPEAIALHDPETMGEFLDTLKSFGLNASDEVIRDGGHVSARYPAGGRDLERLPSEKDVVHALPFGVDRHRWIEGLPLATVKVSVFPEVRPLLDRMRQRVR
jgi:ribosomal protein L40E